MDIELDHLLQLLQQLLLAEEEEQGIDFCSPEELSYVKEKVEKIARQRRQDKKTASEILEKWIGITESVVLIQNDIATGGMFKNCRLHLLRRDGFRQGIDRQKLVCFDIIIMSGSTAEDIQMALRRTICPLEAVFLQLQIPMMRCLAICVA